MIISAGLVGLFLLLGFAGFLLLVVGLAGRSVPVGPSCIRCKGRVSAQEGFPIACPTCGLRLEGPAAIRHHVCRRPMAAIVGGLVLGLLSFVGVIGTAVITRGTMDLVVLAPTTKLIILTGGGSYSAFNELMHRADNGRVTDEEWSDIYPLVMNAMEGNDIVPKSWQSMSWTAFYADLVDRGLIDTEVARALARSLVVLQIETPPDLADGDPMPFRIKGDLTEPGSGDWGGYTSDVTIEVRSIRLNGREIFAAGSTLVTPESDWDYGTNPVTQQSMTTIDWVWEGGEDLPVISGVVEGENTIEIDIHLTSEDGDEASILAGLLHPESAVGGLSFTLTQTRTLAPSRPAVPEPDPSITWSAAGSVAMSFSRACSCGKSPGVKFDVSGAESLPVTAAAYYDVYVECGDERWFLGPRRFDQDSGRSELLLENEQADKIDRNGGATVILEPAPWNALYDFDRPERILPAEPISSWVVFEPEDEEDGEDE